MLAHSSSHSTAASRTQAPRPALRPPSSPPRLSLFAFKIKVFCAFLGLAVSPARAHEPTAATEIAAAAEAFLQTLDEPRARQATFPFDSETRDRWDYTPVARQGLSLKAMTEGQKNAAVALANSILSDQGALKAAQIISLESILGAMENRPDFRDPEKYFVSIFGQPGSPRGWGLRFEGHHLSINVTLVGESVSVTPSFMGANPREVRQGPHRGLRPLADEEDLARALAVSLVESGRDQVLFSKQAPEEILTRQERQVQPLRPVGLAAVSWTEAQRAALVELISAYTGRHRAELAAADWEKIRQAGLDQVHFGWAGSLKLGEAFYYRVQSPTFLLECANTQNDANHIHTVWRDFDGDFGRDLLLEHMESHRDHDSHHHGLATPPRPPDSPGAD